MDQIVLGSMAPHLGFLLRRHHAISHPSNQHNLSHLLHPDK